MKFLYSWVWIAVLVMGQPTAGQAAQAKPASPPEVTPPVPAMPVAPPEPPASSPSEPDPPRAPGSLTYTLGARVKLTDLRDLSGGTIKLRPVIGLRWGRWKVGVGDGTEWLRFAGFRREPSLGYDLLSDPRLQVDFSLRIQNLTTSEDFDPFERGRLTLRGRLLTAYQLNESWSLGAEGTQDLLGRGDGWTGSFGVSRRWLLAHDTLLQSSGGLTWGSRSHWRTAWTPREPDAAQTLGAGWGSLGLGLTIKQGVGSSDLARSRWAWFATLSAAQNLGGIRRIGGSRVGLSAQVGTMRFYR